MKGNIVVFNWKVFFLNLCVPDFAFNLKVSNMNDYNLDKCHIWCPHALFVCLNIFFIVSGFFWNYLAFGYDYPNKKRKIQNRKASTDTMRRDYRTSFAAQLSGKKLSEKVSCSVGVTVIVDCLCAYLHVYIFCFLPIPPYLFFLLISSFYLLNCSYINAKL